MTKPTTHGGRRKGAGRHLLNSRYGPVVKHSITLHKMEWDYLMTIDPNRSQAIRKLIAASK
jgi:hypothetical protein